MTKDSVCVRAVETMWSSVGGRPRREQARCPSVPGFGRPGRLTRVQGLNSNLNLNGDASPRVRPRVGEWAPADVPTTRRKRHQRVWTIVVATLALTVVVAFGTFAYFQLRGF